MCILEAIKKQEDQKDESFNQFGLYYLDNEKPQVYMVNGKRFIYNF